MKMKDVYLLTITDNENNEYSDKNVFKSVYSDEVIARHYMLKDILEQFEKGRITNLDGIYNNCSYYKNNNIIWHIEKVLFTDGI